MKTNLEKAKEILKNGDYTLVLCRGDEVITSKERGIKPLMELYEKGQSLSGFSAADKVVGKAAAFLYVLLNIDEVYACVLSDRAKKVLESAGIKAECDCIVPSIKNRMGTGMCPMEQAVWDISSPEKAYEAITGRLEEMKKAGKKQ